MREVELISVPKKGEVYQVLEFVIRVSNQNFLNPFTEVSVKGVFSKDDGETKTIKGFCDSYDGSLYKVRFTPQSVGTYKYEITYRDSETFQVFRGIFDVVASSRKGFIRADPNNPYHFIYENGGHPFIFSKTAWMIGASRNWYAFIDNCRKDGFTCIRFALEGKFFSQGMGDVWPWGGTRNNLGGQRDFTKFNVSQWRIFDDIIQYALSREILVEPVVFTSIRKREFASYPIPDPTMELYWDYILARLSGYPNIVLWELFNEFDKEYDYQKYMGTYFHEHDPYKHLVATSFGTTGTAAWADKDWVDVAIYHSCTGDGDHGFPISWYYEQATKIHKYNKPAWCDETGREVRHKNNDGVHRRKQYWTWYMAGDYTNYHSHGGCQDIESLLKGPGEEYCKYITSFLEKIRWWEMNPKNETIVSTPNVTGAFCLLSENECVVYLYLEKTGGVCDGGTLNLRLPQATYSAKLYNPSDGTYLEPKELIYTNNIVSINIPRFKDDLVVYLSKR
ncbi:MAG: hypothetical protein DRJ38_03310 [Thermoprotei archaeon]|nr:MAG: hypothetical protein DRJ38_03310 [Thermoprotei archaeon]